MTDLNEVIVSGRLTRDSELRRTPNGTAVTDVIIASNRIWSKDSERQEETTFVDVTIWGRQAESLQEYLVKGRHIMVVGRLKLNKWETEQGDKRSKLTMVAEKISGVCVRHLGAQDPPSPTCIDTLGQPLPCRISQ